MFGLVVTMSGVAAGGAGGLLTRSGLGVPGERERYVLRRDLVVRKVNELLLPAMRVHGIDMWIVLDREYHPDPLAVDIGGEGGVRNAAVFFDTGDRLEKIYIFSHPAREDLVGLLYDELINYGYRPEGLRPYLARVVSERGPRRIGVNMSVTLPMADGLSVESPPSVASGLQRTGRAGHNVGDVSRGIFFPKYQGGRPRSGARRRGAGRDAAGHDHAAALAAGR